MRGVKKENLPQKVCVVCDRPFTWRKKWEKVWDEVTTCSKSCNRKRREKSRQDNRRERVEGDDDDDVDENDEEVKSHGSGSGGKIAAADTASVGSRRSDGDVESVIKTIETMGDQIEGLDINSLADDDIGSNDDDNKDEEDIELDPNARRKAERKAAKKARKAARRAEREGRGDSTAGQKECDMCSKSVDLLVRCKHKESKGEWEMVCGKCWNVASGGVVDGDANHPEYQYGGLWKNRRAQKV